MLEALRERGLTPVVTIHHYTLPLWIHDAVGCTRSFSDCTERGWLDRERIVREIAKYAGFVARELGGLVDLWATQNEPFAVIISAYLQQTEERSNPPAQIMNADAAREAFVSMVEAHARMVDALRENDLNDADADGQRASIGLVHAMAPILPMDPEDEQDVEAAQNIFYLWNLLMLEAVALGRLDDDLDGEGQLREDLVGRLDWIGLNYKHAMTVAGLGGSLLPDLSPLLTLDPFNIDLSRVIPRGLYEMLVLLQTRYQLPIYITENNGRQMWAGEQELENQYVTENLQWVARALDEGIDVRGYIYWAFMDNYEWNHGMNVRLGLFAVDPDDPTKSRTPRPTADLLTQIAQARDVTDELRQHYPIDPDDPPSGGIPSE